MVMRGVGFVAVVFLVLTSACQLHSNRLNELIISRDFDGADRYYAANRNYFRGEHPESTAQLRSLAEQVNQQQGPTLAEAVDSLQVQAWPAPQNQWPEIKAAIVKAENALTSYNRYELLNEKEYRHPLASKLEGALPDLKDKIRQSAQRMFIEFNHYGDVSFFDIYPILLVSKAVLKESYGALSTKLAAATTGELKKFQRYAGELDIPIFVDLSNIYVRAYIRENTLQSPSRLASTMAAVKAARDAGFSPDPLSGIAVAAAVVIPPTIGKDAIRFEADWPVKFLDNPYASLSGKADFDYLLLVNVLAADTTHAADKVENVKSQFVSGYQTLPNPDYPIAVANVNNARTNLANVKFRQAVDTCPNCGLVGGILHGIGNAVELSGAESRLTEAMRILQNTPMTVERPVVQEYSFRKTFLTSSKRLTATCFLVDMRARTFVKFALGREDKNKAQVLYQLHDKDTLRQAHLASGVLESDVVSWEQAAINVKASELFAVYLKTATENLAAEPIEQLQKQIANESKLVSFNRSNPGSASTLNDARFQAVVVVHNNKDGSLGAGFFVTPDIVLTNYHVVQDATYVEMKMYGGVQTFGKVMKYDARLDLALIKVQSRGNPLEIYAEPDLRAGSAVEAIGHPEGLEFSITRGVVSAVRKRSSILVPGTGDVLTIQTDAMINHGNSGGPLFLGDKVVGVVTYRRSNTSEGLNFAVHYSEVAKFLKDNLPAS